MREVAHILQISEGVRGPQEPHLLLTQCLQTGASGSHRGQYAVFWSATAGSGMLQCSQAPSQMHSPLWMPPCMQKAEITLVSRNSKLPYIGL